MSTDYRAISAENERKLGTDRASRMSQVSMYADTAHFVFEILQNADDAGATEIFFDVRSDRLIIEHNGKPFTSENVEGISYFGKGKTDITKIGHFGLGFKSVFAYTASPRIHSGDESFEITDLYSLEAVPLPADLRRDRTRFVLPFDHETRRPAYIEPALLKKPSVARSEIAEKLTGLGPETLLFTRNLAEIRWEAGGRPGHYLRDERCLPGGGKELRVVSESSEEACFLVFDQPVDADKSEGPRTSRLVQVAYKLSQKLADGGMVCPVAGAKLFVFFETDKETHTGVIFQGPYRTTPARDNVPQHDDFNRQLVQKTADLLVDSVLQLKRLKLLTLDALSTLPLDFEKFPEVSFFYPIHAAIRNALQRLPLLPTSTGGFVAATQAKMARGADLTRVFDTEQLETLFAISGVRWLDPALTSVRYPALHQLLVGKRNSQPGSFQKAAWALQPLAADVEVSAESLASRLTADFLKKQSDEWLIRFMRYIAKSGSYLFRRVPIVRLESGEHVLPEAITGQPNAYLPPKERSAELHGLPMVRASLLLKKDIADFLEDDLGLGPPDLADIALKKILPRYKKLQEEVILSRWKKDFRIIASGLDTDSHAKKIQLEREIGSTSCLVGTLPGIDDGWALVKPSELYIRSPEIEAYFDGSDSFYLTPDDAYDEGDREILINMGVAAEPRVDRRSKMSDGSVPLRNQHGWHVRGIDGFDPNWKIEGLSAALDSPTLIRSRVIWRVLLSHSSCIRGVTESSTRQSFESPARKDEISTTGKKLMDACWLPRVDGAFVTPREVTLEELPAGFEKASSQARALADKLGMKKSEEQEAIAVFSRGDARKRRIAEMLMNASDEQIERLEKLIPKQRDFPEFKSFKEGMQSMHRAVAGGSSELVGEPGPVANPARYRKSAEDAVRESIASHNAKPRVISFSVARDSTSNKFAREFLDKEYQGRCQITGNTFQKSTGGNYFEALCLVSRIDAEYLNDPGNMLCLCPEFAAKLMHASFSWIDCIEEKVREFKTHAEGGEETMRQVSASVSGQPVTVTWSERHFLKLCALWKIA